VFLRRALTAPHTTMILLTAGIAMVIQQLIILIVGPHTKFVPSMIRGSTTVVVWSFPIKQY
jgi:branched-subunit amino acid ABC-type transport system permease component